MIDFSLADEQADMVAAMRALLANECTTALLRAHMDDPAVVDALWAHLRGWVAIADGQLVDLVLVAGELGYVAAPGPFTTTAIALPLVRALDVTLGDRVASGEVVATVAAVGEGGDWWAGPTSGDALGFVLEADRADVVLRVGPGGLIGLAEVTACDEMPTLDTTRRLFRVEVAPPRDERDVGVAVYAAWLGSATVVVAAELAGTAHRILDMSVAYAKERVQFGVPIGSFQAIQHQLADMAVSVERATAAVGYAAMAIDAQDADSHRAVHVAKAAAGHAATHCARQGIQVHGGIGYTWDHDLHLFIRRAYASEHLFGTSTQHHDLLADLLFR
ncbi:MAG: acyl-CoA dehydrogenase family protein [Acidimicrobiales bacterium]